MKILESRRLAALLATVMGTASGCADDGSDDDGSDDGQFTSTFGDSTSDSTAGSTAGTSGGSTSGSTTTSTTSNGDETMGVDESSTGEPTSEGSTSVGESSEGSSESGETPAQPTLPDVLSLSGCEDIDVGPLCTVVQEGATIEANCGGVLYTGEIAVDGSVEWAAPEYEDENGATVTTSCEGTYGLGQLQLTCQQTISATSTTESTETTCDAASARTLLPDVSCMELPAEIEDFVLCVEGEENGSVTLEGGSCRVIQDQCSFQANCENDLVLTGSVTATGIDFRQILPALADAETPAEGEPAFLAGAEVQHRCSGAVEGTSLAGSCEAGAAGRGGTHTSLCAVTGEVEPLPSCEAISPAGSESLFVLDSCSLLKDGETPEAAIGEPICAFRQNNCIWETQCGRGDQLKYAGRLEPGDASVTWTLATGTPCELGFDEEGNAFGSCTVAGEEPCQLSSTEPVPGGDACPTLPSGTEFYSHGCGGGDPLDCRLALQHGCDYMAICTFASSNPSVVFAGETLYQDERARFEFNGIEGYSCYVDQATEEEITSGDRVASEWYGQCTNPSGGQCRDNYDPETGTGYRGLRLFFEPRPEVEEE